MSTLRRRIPVLVGTLALVGAGVIGAVFLTTGASAGHSGTLDDGKDLLPQASITIDQAIAAATSAASGPVDEIDLEYYDGVLVFNVDVGDFDVKVDAKTGVVLATPRDE